ISTAVKDRGPDTTVNAAVKAAMEQGKRYNMPKDNIERAIKTGTGELVGEVLEAVSFEVFFFFQAEDGIRGRNVTGVQTCALPILKGDELIDKGDVVVTDSRLACVAATCPAPAGARIIDVTGKSVIPGLIDIHAHAWP